MIAQSWRAAKAEQRLAASQRERGAERELVRRRGEHQPGAAGHRVDEQALAVDRHRDHPGAVAREQVAGEGVAGILHDHHVAGLQQHPGDQVERLLGAVGDHDVVGFGLDPARVRQVAREGGAQVGMALRLGVRARARRRGGRRGEQPPPGVEREEGGVGDADAEVVRRRSPRTRSPGGAAPSRSRGAAARRAYAGAVASRGPRLARRTSRRRRAPRGDPRRRAARRRWRRWPGRRRGRRPGSARAAAGHRAAAGRRAGRRAGRGRAPWRGHPGARGRRSGPHAQPTNRRRTRRSESRRPDGVLVGSLAPGVSGSESGGALADRGLAVGGLVLVDDALGGGLVELACGGAAEPRPRRPCRRPRRPRGTCARRSSARTSRPCCARAASRSACCA